MYRFDGCFVWDIDEHDSAAYQHLRRSDASTAASPGSPFQPGTSSQHGHQSPAVGSSHGCSVLPQSTLLHNVADVSENFDAQYFSSQLGSTDFTRSIGLLTPTCKALNWIEQFETTLIGLGLAPFLDGIGSPIMNKAVRCILRITMCEELKDSYLDWYGSTYENYVQMRTKLVQHFLVPSSKIWKTSSLMDPRPQSPSSAILTH